MSNLEIRKKIAEDLMDRVDRDKYVDVGTGAECAYGVSQEQFMLVLNKLMKNGYIITIIKIPCGGLKPVSTKILSKVPLTEEEKKNNYKRRLIERMKLMQPKAMKGDI